MTAVPPVSTSGTPPAPRPRPAVSIVALVAANAIPLLGVVFWGWRVFPILLIYWVENVTAGVFNVLRMLAAEPGDIVRWVAKLFLIPFFCIHYGMFTAVHGSFVFAMFGPNNGGRGLFPSVATVRAAIHENGIDFAVFALVMSHVVSFVWNYILGGEFRRVSLRTLMTQPYQRLIVLHLVIILGGMATVALGSPMAAVVVLVVIKTAIDIAAHSREHAKLADGEDGQPDGPAPWRFTMKIGRSSEKER